MSFPAPTDEQLADMVRFIARTCVEVERGLRPPEQLAQFLDRRTGAAWRTTNPIGRFDGGPVLRRDIGIPQLTRVDDELVRASVTTRTDHHRWGALVMELRPARGRWAVANLQRLLAATHYRSSEPPDRPEIPLEERIESAASERTAVQAALRATRSRLAELSKTDPAHPLSEEMVASWSRIGAELDRELVTLRSKLDLHTTLGKGRARWRPNAISTGARRRGGAR